MVGVGVALHLQQRGRDVVLVDRRGAGEETSYGNAGLIQREAVIPYTFPREFGVILSYAMNNRRDAVKAGRPVGVLTRIGVLQLAPSSSENDATISV